MNPQRRLGGFLQITIASVCFGFIGIFGKIAFQQGLSVGELLSYRFILAASLLWMGMILFRPDWTRISWTQFLISAGLGIFGYAFFATLYFKAVEGLSVALAALLLYTYPLWVQLITYFMGEKPSRWQLMCTGLAFGGLLLLLWGQINISSFIALLCGLSSAVAYAAYIVVSGRYQREIRPLTSSLYVITFCALTLTIFHNPSIAKLEEFSTTQALTIFGIAIIGTLIPMTLVLASLQKLKKTEVALFAMLEPVTAAVASWLILGESLNSRQLLGGVLILLGLGLRLREKVK